MAIFACWNSRSRIPRWPLFWPISCATFCCNVARETTKPHPKTICPSYRCWPKHEEDQQYATPYSKIIRSNEVTLLIAQRTPQKPLNLFNFDSIHMFWFRHCLNACILVSIKLLFSSTNPRLSLWQIFVALITYNTCVLEELSVCLETHQKIEKSH